VSGSLYSAEFQCVKQPYNYAEMNSQRRATFSQTTNDLNKFVEWLKTNSYPKALLKVGEGSFIARKAAVSDRELSRNTIINCRKLVPSTTRQSQTADSAPGVATWEVTLSARKLVPCVRWPATGITAQFIAKPKAACALRCSWAATSSNLGL